MGSEMTVIPADRPLLLHLNAKDLPEEKVAVQVVSADGNEVWKGDSAIHDSTVDAKLPKFHERAIIWFASTSRPRTPRPKATCFANSLSRLSSL